MNEDIKQAWIDALESGEYRQGRGSLVQTYETTGEKSFCCLGVLCDIAANAGVAEYDDSGKKEGYKTLTGFETAVLPLEVWLWAGLEEEYNPIVYAPYSDDNPEKTIPRPIAGLNDDGMPFKDIANYIREQL